jgi:hypothetical protein
MSSEKLIRCEIERADGSGRGVRYVPLEIFGLWEHLMATRHGFRVCERSASVWVEVDEGRAPGQARSRGDRVTELCLFVFDAREGMLHRTCRYAPTEDLERVRQVLLDHYRPPEGSPGPAPWLRERAGMWFRPRAAAAGVAGASGQAG